ncbi:hypothetical protein HYW87_02240 [Candidatus Roizmanbacteria bacterium]|nr:hypothetical protein [Candidatus Roizmanbacteria bacterium]
MTSPEGRPFVRGSNKSGPFAADSACGGSCAGGCGTGGGSDCDAADLGVNRLKRPVNQVRPLVKQPIRPTPK